MYQKAEDANQGNVQEKAEVLLYKALKDNLLL